MRKIGLLLLVLVLAAGGIWSALWFYAAHEAEVQFDGWIAAERRAGRQWTCEGRHVGGFPLALMVSCGKLAYTGQGMGQRVEATIAGLSAAVRIDHPRRIAINLQAPFAFRTSDGSTDLKGSWRMLRLDLGAIPTIRTADLHATGVSIDGVFPGADRQNGKAEALDATFVRSQDQPDPTLDFDVALGGLTLPIVDELLGGTAPADIVVGGRLDRAEIVGAATPEQAMEQWRQADGRVDIGRAQASRAGASISATGTLRLDDAHRPKGRLDAEFQGLEPILKRYGINANMMAIGSLVGTLFGGRAGHASATPGALDLPISLNNGRLGVGPITTAIELTPLY